MNIVLVGMPGSGKSVVSFSLALKLGLKAVDTDACIVEQYGNVSEIFAEHGEEYFRRIESEVVQQLSTAENIVIATGGGCLINPQNILALKVSGKIIYLKTDIKELILRLNGDTSRPLLKGDMEAKLKELYNRRAKIYEAAADYIVQTDGLTPDEIAEKILELLK